jgi:hypothetical protein
MCFPFGPTTSTTSSSNSSTSVERYGLHGGSSCLERRIRHSPRSRSDRTRREDRHLKFYPLRDNLLRNVLLFGIVGSRGRVSGVGHRPPRRARGDGVAVGTSSIEWRRPRAALSGQRDPRHRDSGPRGRPCRASEPGDPACPDRGPRCRVTKHSLSRSREELAVARLIADEGFPAQAVSRAYYAAF